MGVLDGRGLNVVISDISKINREIYTDQAYPEPQLWLLMCFSCSYQRGAL